MPNKYEVHTYSSTSSTVFIEAEGFEVDKQTGFVEFYEGEPGSLKSEKVGLFRLGHGDYVKRIKDGT